MKKEDIKTILINLLSSLLWQIIITVSFSLNITGLINFIKYNIFNSRNNSIINSIFIFIIVETILFFTFILLSRKFVNDKISENVDNNINSKLIEENEQKEDDTNLHQDEDYFFNDYVKHITVYKNGNGIIMDTFNIIVNNYENCNEIKRKLNVDDGKKMVSFPPFSKMKNTSKDKRFTDYGFWVYKPSDSIIGSTIERYWSDNDPDEIDYISEHNEKELRWVFKVNKNKLKNKKEHKISYAISIPGMYPIENGHFVKDIANEPEGDGKSSSSIYVEHFIKKITYIISFEAGIKLIDEPECYTVKGKKNPIHDFYVEEGIFYNKYIFTINEPSYGTNIIIKWRYRGGDNMDKEGGD